MNTVWIVVANNKRARIFEPSHEDSTLRLVETTRYRSGSPAGGSESDESPAHDDGRGGTALDSHASVEDPNIIGFAQRLSGRLSDARAGGAYQRLALIAPPGFLKSLKAALSPEIAELVKAEVEADIVDQKISVIKAQLPAIVR